MSSTRLASGRVTTFAFAMTFLPSPRRVSCSGTADLLEERPPLGRAGLRPPAAEPRKRRRVVARRVGVFTPARTLGGGHRFELPRVEAFGDVGVVAAQLADSVGGCS